MSDLLKRHDRVVAPVLTYDTDLFIERAQGLWVYDRDGNRWADFACGTAVTNLGHNHPAVVEAAHRQLDLLAHGGYVFRFERLVELGERLREITPDGIETFGFANSGAEAVEAAVKLAKKTTGRQGVIVFRGAFHGRTMGSVTYTTSNAKYRDGYHPVLGSVFVSPFPHPYRWGVDEDEAVDRCLDDLALKFKHEVTPGTIAALLVEPVQGEGGYYPAPARFLTDLRALADRHGIKLIFDEVQTGFGRTAEWFAADHFPVVPDIIAIGKGVANGLPLSVYGASEELMGAWPPGSHGTTYGGNPVACAASLAVIETMGGLLGPARELSARAVERFQKAAASHPTIGDVRGLGLMIGVELVRDPDTREPDPDAMSHLAAYALERELIVISCGPDGNVVRFIPPLVTTGEELDWAIGIVEEAITDYER
ncbi:MAG: aminotransferase class III-fold pyridoxal phosphate-dependent enzyme [Acidimicrobiia bacterium]